MHNIALVPIGLLAAAAATAQTTWSSFEGRHGHAIAGDSAGGVLMFGGESNSGGQLLRDTCTYDGTWTSAVLPGSPSARTEHAIASAVGTDDTAIFILFGGLAIPSTGGSPVPSDETFVYEGGGWGNVGNLAVRPSARTGHAMVADPNRNTVVLFGGYGNNASMNDLWEFDAVNQVWIQRIASSQAGSPPTRYDHSMAFHPGNGGTDGRVYVFGGTPFRSDTWELNPWTSPPTWTNLTPSVSPPGRRRSALAYLPSYDHLVLFGGEAPGNVVLDDTWVWDRTTGTWTQPQQPLTFHPPARFNHAMATDQLGNNIILLGGENSSVAGAVLDGTWFWNGADWTDHSPPAPRSGVAMAYDTVRDRNVALGGRDANGDHNDTIELSGVDWTHRNPVNSPSPRADYGIAYDSARHRTVLYGGRIGGPCGVENGETWEWDGTNWQQRSPVSSPPPLGGTQAAFDSTRSLLWLLGGDDLWSFDGTTWSNVPLIARRSAEGALDPARSRIVLFGGVSGPSGTPSNNETWEWDGGQWSRRTPPASPSARRLHGMVYDPLRSEIVLVGGDAGSSGTPVPLRDTWTWNGTNWTQRASLPSGEERYGSGISFDSTRGRVVRFKGTSGTGLKIAEWDGTTWTVISAGGGNNRFGAATAFDEARGTTLIFGGSSSEGGTPVSDTYTWDGASLVLLTPTTVPSPRCLARAVYDSASQRVIMFGGIDAAGSRLNELWAWDGTDWSHIGAGAPSSPEARSGAIVTRSLSGGGMTVAFGDGVSGQLCDTYEWDGASWARRFGRPASRTNYGAAYDARRDRLVVFGGRDQCSSGNYHSDTWEWNGSIWQQRFPQHSPSARERCQLSYDTARSRVVLYGGSDGTPTPLDDVWEWDGQDWKQRSTSAVPPRSAGHALGYDAEHGVTVAFGDLGTWRYGPTVPAEILAFGSGCTGSNGTPTLSPKPWAGPWLGDRFECDITNRPPGLGIFVWGFSNTSWLGITLPMSFAQFGSPLCFLRASDDIHELLLPNTNPYVSFVLPNHPSFLGAVMYGQAGFFDTGLGNQIVTTNGLMMTFGGK